MIREAVQESMRKGARLSVVCERLGVSERTFQRWCTREEDGRRGPLTEPANKLSSGERDQLIATANSAEFRDVPPSQIVPRLADRGVFLASESTFYRTLRAASLMARRGRAKAPVPRPKPQLLATGPNQVWTWDISYLRSPVRGSFFYLYMVVDIFSRRVVGWDVHEEESSILSSALVKRAVTAAGNPVGLTLHSDNGGPMRGMTMLAMLQSLGLSASFSRPGVSDDNPFSESLFRTVKYSSIFPTRPFESLESARTWVAGFVDWYNTKHRHSGLRFVTPEQRHLSQDGAILEKRTDVYESARRRNPSRWAGAIRDWRPVTAVRLGSATDAPEEAAQAN